MTITFATANRASLAELTPRGDGAKSFAKAPDPKRSEIKRQVRGPWARRGAGGGSAAPAGEAARSHRGGDAARRLHRGIGHWSLADAAATPYVWRLDKLKLARLWDTRPGVAAWYQRIRQRPSFKTAVEDWVTPADHERYAKEPDPWPKVSRDPARGLMTRCAACSAEPRQQRQRDAARDAGATCAWSCASAR